MRYRTRPIVVGLLALGLGGAVLASKNSAASALAGLPEIRANQNTVPAGTLGRGVLRLSLVAERGRLFPDGPGGVGLPVEAFAEAGKMPSVPGPFVRVPVGTRVVVSLRNVLDHAIVVRGLGPSEQRYDSVLRVAAGATRTTEFVLDSPGIYGYYGADRDTSLDNRLGADAELSGAILVEAPHAPRVDHVFVLGLYDAVNTKSEGPNFLYMLETINGRSFPATERLTYPRGAVVRWAVVNTSAMTHPMHLHGFYFRRSGKDAADEVTHAFHPGETGTLAWTADRAGNWMYHCHISDHIAQHAPLADMLAPPPSAAAITPATVSERFHLADRPMGGMVVAITVTAPPGSAPPPVAAHPRRLAMTIVDHEQADSPYPGLRKSEVTLDDGSRETHSSGNLGPPIVLRRGEPVAIAVTNHLNEQTSMHWHGIALQDSYYDGGAGMGAMPASMGMTMDATSARMSPPIDPGGTFVARFAPPDAGTFMYHAHMDDGWQQGSGVVGPLIVLPAGARAADPADHVVMLSETFEKAGSPFVAINGTMHPAPLVMRVGVAQRIRILCLTLGGQNLVASLSDGSRVLQWQPIAKDGRDLPARLQMVRPSTTAMTIGETRDFRFVPAAQGELSLRVYDDDNNGMLVGTLPITVTAP
jgi:FtsP/CotA-like multicopper oxidase with cupredoxin domain